MKVTVMKGLPDQAGLQSVQHIRYRKGMNGQALLAGIEPLLISGLGAGCEKGVKTVRV